MSFARDTLVSLLVAVFVSGCVRSAELESAAQPEYFPTPAATALATIGSPAADQNLPLPVSTEAVPVLLGTPTPDPGETDLPYYYGGLVLTLNDVGQELRMKTGQGFMLRLGEGYAWQVTLDPPDILTSNRKIELTAAEQGVYIARKKGAAVMNAVGVPVCRNETPACARPEVLFQMRFVVE